MIKGIIFDLDGVLLSTDEYHFRAWKHVANGLGIPFDRTVNNLLRGVSRMASLAIILGEHGARFTDAEKEALAAEKNELYRSFLSDMTPASVADGVRKTLAIIRTAGLKTAVGSSSKNTKYILERTDLSRYFDAVCDGNDIARSKPDPEVFLKAALFIGLTPSECLVVEDAHAGIDAAKDGGFVAVAFGDARTHRSADYRIDRLPDLLPILGIDADMPH